MDDMLGAVAFSTAGRDKGSPFVIIGSPEEGFLFLADGKKRKIENPKKKKIKHISVTGICFEEIRTKLIKHDKITNADLKKALRNISNEEMIRG